MPTDFRDGKTFPRRGREPLGGFLWLARVYDKARAKANRTNGAYNYPCPIDRGMMRQWGINAEDFTMAAAGNTTDDQILAWLSQRAGPDRMQAANDWLTSSRSSNLDRHDFEEGVPGAAKPGPSREIILGIFAAVVAIIAALIERSLH
ncbi:MAG TPA: DUF5069 domain-containing protein [Candidatus Eremiobacteraceae bacterium]|nr:DUF5069 domain-containing protein [Candidatus Eremiobacteraceae bacterium]